MMGEMPATSIQNETNVHKIEKAGRRRETRVQLLKMSLEELQKLLHVRQSEVKEANDLLMSLLLDRDSLHMEHDAMVVDLEDVVKQPLVTSNYSLPENPCGHELKRHRIVE
jgi:uncharacterized protein YcbK (DUF882 family)